MLFYRITHFLKILMDFLMDFLRILDVIYKEFLNFWPFLLILSYKRLSYKKKACILTNMKFSRAWKLSLSIVLKIFLIFPEPRWFLWGTLTGTEMSLRRKKQEGKIDYHNDALLSFQRLVTPYSISRRLCAKFVFGWWKLKDGWTHQQCIIAVS